MRLISHNLRCHVLSESRTYLCVVNLCYIVCLISAQAFRENKYALRRTTLNHVPHINPPVDFRLRISVCSMTKSGESPTHTRPHTPFCSPDNCSPNYSSAADTAKQTSHNYCVHKLQNRDAFLTVTTNAVFSHPIAQSE